MFSLSYSKEAIKIIYENKEFINNRFDIMEANEDDLFLKQKKIFISFYDKPFKEWNNTKVYDSTFMELKSSEEVLIKSAMNVLRNSMSNHISYLDGSEIITDSTVIKLLILLLDDNLTRYTAYNRLRNNVPYSLLMYYSGKIKPYLEKLKPDSQINDYYDKRNEYATFVLKLGDTSFYKFIDTVNHQAVKALDNLKNSKKWSKLNEERKKKASYNYLNRYSSSNFPLHLKAKMGNKEALKLLCDQYDSIQPDTTSNNLSKQIPFKKEKELMSNLMLIGSIKHVLKDFYSPFYLDWSPYLWRSKPSDVTEEEWKSQECHSEYIQLHILKELRYWHPDNEILSLLLKNAKDPKTLQPLFKKFNKWCKKQYNIELKGSFPKGKQLWKLCATKNDYDIK